MKFKRFFIITTLIMPLIFSGCGMLNKTSTNKQTEKKEEIKTAVEVMKLEEENMIDEYYTTGKLYANEEVGVSTKVSGRVDEIYFDIGEKVNKGDILFTIENEDLLTNVDLQTNNLQKALENARISYEDALKKYNDMKLLYEEGATSQSDYNKAKSAYNQAKISYERAQKELESNTKSLNLSVEDTKIKSPISGIIAKRSIEEGEMAVQNAFTIVNLESIKIKTTVSSRVVDKISIGDNVRVNIDSNYYTGKITSVSPISENNSNIYPVEIQVTNDNMVLKPGMFADVYFQLQKLENQVLVPKKAVLLEDSEKFVYVAENNKAKKVVVSVGKTIYGRVQIIEGLKSGDVLVIQGQEYLDENTAINITNKVANNDK